jgi:hypothetical protein
MSGNDKVELMKSLGISVKDNTYGDNLYLGRHGIFIPYNIMNFLLFEEDVLVKDVLRRFRETSLDDDPVKRMNDWWEIARKEHELELMISTKPKEESEILLNPISEKKRNIRNILTDKGLLCSEIE